MNLREGYRMVYTMLGNAMSVFLQNFHCILRPSISMDKRGHSNFASHPKVIHNHLISNDFLIHFSNISSWINTSFGCMSHDRRTALRNIILLYSFTFLNSIVSEILWSCYMIVDGRNSRNKHSKLCILACSYSLEDYKGQYIPLSPNHRGR